MTQTQLNQRFRPGDPLRFRECIAGHEYWHNATVSHVSRGALFIEWRNGIWMQTEWVGIDNDGYSPNIAPPF
jgi:hypothetical protein